MKLHSPRFEKKLRQAVVKTVRASKELRRETRRSQLARKYQSLWFRPFISAALATVVLVNASIKDHPQTALAIVNLWLLFMSFLQAQRLWQILHTAPDLQALFALPMSNATILRWEFQKFLYEMFFLTGDVAAGLGVICCFFNLSPACFLAIIPTAALSCGVAISLSLLYAARMPSRIYRTIGVVMTLIALATFFGYNFFGYRVLNAIDQHAFELNLLLPTGWAFSFFQWPLTGFQWMFLWTPVLALLVVATAKNSYQHLKPVIQFHEIPFSQALDAIDDEEFTSTSSGNQLNLQHVDLTTIRESIESRRFLAPPRWPSAGWFEQRLWRWFNDREKRLVEFAFPEGFAITRPWMILFRNLIMAGAIGFASGSFSPVIKGGIIASGLFVTFCQCLFQIQSGEAFRMISCGGVSIPIYAAYSVGFRELAEMLFKCTVIQLPFLFLFGLISGALLASILDVPAGLGGIIGFKAALLLLGSRYIFLTLAFSSKTNDGTSFHLRTVMTFLALAAGIILFVFLAITGLYVSNLIAWIFLLLSIFQSYAVFRIYGWFYHQNRFDLMKPSQ